MELFENFVYYLRDFNLVSVAVRLVLAVVIGGFVGLEREMHGRAAGLRTHILVCMGATMAMLVPDFVLNFRSLTADPTRIGAQVLSGIGFLGVGTIVAKGRFHVTGLTTAAGLWTTATVGLAIGIGFYEGAIIGALLEFTTMTLLSKFDAHMFKKSKKFRVYIEISDVTTVNTIVSHLESMYNATGIQITTPRSGISGNAGIECTLHFDNIANYTEIIKELTECDSVVFALPSI